MNKRLISYLLLSGVIFFITGLSYTGGTTPSTPCLPSSLIAATTTYYQKLKSCLYGSAYASCVANCNPQCNLTSNPAACSACQTNNCGYLKQWSDKYQSCLTGCGCDIACVNENCTNLQGNDYVTCLTNCKCNTSCAALTGCNCDFNCIATNCIGKTGTAYTSCMQSCKCNMTCVENNCSNIKPLSDQYQACVNDCASPNACVVDCNHFIDATQITPTLVFKCRQDPTNPLPLQVCSAKSTETECNTALACGCLCTPQESALRSLLLPFITPCTENCGQDQVCRAQCDQAFMPSLGICSTPISQGGQGYSSCTLGWCITCPAQ